MSDELEVDGGSHAPIWAAFGDLMSVLLGAFVLILVGVVAVQLELSQRLDQEVKQRQAEAKRLQTLEQALARPPLAGRPLALALGGLVGRRRLRWTGTDAPSCAPSPLVPNAACGSKTATGR